MFWEDVEFSAEPEPSCISASLEEAVTSEESGNGLLQAHKYICVLIYTMEEILVSPLTDGFLFVLFRIERVSKIREFKNHVQQEIPINCWDAKTLATINK